MTFLPLMTIKTTSSCLTSFIVGVDRYRFPFTDCPNEKPKCLSILISLLGYLKRNVQFWVESIVTCGPRFTTCIVTGGTHDILAGEFFCSRPQYIVECNLECSQTRYSKLQVTFSATGLKLHEHPSCDKSNQYQQGLNVHLISSFRRRSVF